MVHELLRLYTPLTLLHNCCTATFTSAAGSVPKGTVTFWNACGREIWIATCGATQKISARNGSGAARDVQEWEYVRCGPSTAKNFGISIFHCEFTSDALEPF
ncbi:hypothetical protein V1504DRAFT_443020 [Lipomyces starkeyi]